MFSRKKRARKDNIQELVDQYLFQKRSGEAPSVEEYVQRHPDYENELREALNDFEWIHAALSMIQQEEQEEEAEELPEEELEAAWQTFRRRVGLASPWEVLLGNPRSSAARIVKPFVQRFFKREAPQFDTIRSKLYQILEQGLLSTQRMQPIPQEAMGFSGSGRRGARKLYSVPLILSTLYVLEHIVQPLVEVPALQEQPDILAQIKAQKQEMINLIQERGLTPEQAQQFAEHLIHYLETM